MKHLKSVEKYSGTLEELAKDIINMRYDSVAEFFEYLSEKLIADSINDYHRGRKQLSNKLLSASEKMLGAKEIMDSIWKICKEHMR
ncbi:hypothetical protein M0R19_01125 [Candidatus Pacearchaeota archaeon]|nr:hypothetical protein [Candidatus Pacearchaeota archaeon]